MASRSDPETGCSDDVEVPSAPLPALERSLSEQGVPLGLGLPIPTRAVLHEQRYAIELRSRSRARTVTFSKNIEDTPIDRLQECTQHVQSPSTERSPPGSRCSPSTSSMLSFDSFDSFNSVDSFDRFDADDATSDDDSADECSSFAWLSGGGATRRNADRTSESRR